MKGFKSGAPPKNNLVPGTSPAPGQRVKNRARDWRNARSLKTLKRDAIRQRFGNHAVFPILTVRAEGFHSLPPVQASSISPASIF